MRKLLLALTAVVALGLATVSAAMADATPGPIQVAGQSATTVQQAAAGSSATQTDPTNTNISIRVLSPGNDGNVSQSNTAGSSASAGNLSSTGQGSSQTASGGDAIQQSLQIAATAQLAAAVSAASQTGASNLNVPIRVLSPGNGGSVTQSNGVGSSSSAGNASGTTQSGTQAAAGSSCGCSGSTATAPIQTADQSAQTEQGAVAGSTASQVDPSNENVSIRVLSPGNDGNVSQSNTAGSSASAGNAASTSQGSSQSAAGSQCGCSGSAIQQAGQSAGTGQGAEALSGAAQQDPSNASSPVAVSSNGTGGAVTQSNGVGSRADAGNVSGTTQTGTQSAAGNAIQIAQQEAVTEQAAEAASLATQAGASNEASPVRVGSAGNGGSVSQSNDAGSSASAANAAGTQQGASQAAAGGCGCAGGLGVQVLGQQAGTEQEAVALSGARQIFPSPTCGCGPSSGNSASPVRVDSAGNGGSVAQDNTVGSRADAGNLAGTVQSGTQTASGGGLRIQVLGQLAQTLQQSAAGSLAEQAGASNDASPTRVSSGGNDGSVHQSNDAASSAAAGNGAQTVQYAGQTIAGSHCGCSGSLPIQVAGQHAGTGQAAHALSAVSQLWPQNAASPTRVSSSGNGGSTAQANGAASRGDALNLAATLQAVMQTS